MKRVSQLFIALSLLVIAGLFTPALGQLKCTNSIVDNANSIDAQSKAALEGKIHDMHNKTGVEMFVYTTNEFTSNNDLITEALNACPAIRSGANGLADKTVFIAVAVSPRKYATGSGAGVRTATPEWLVSFRETEMRPYLRNQNVAGAIGVAIEKIGNAETPPPWGLISLGLLVALLILLLGLYLRRRSRETEHRREMQTELRRLAAKIGELVQTQIPRFDILKRDLTIAGFKPDELEPILAQLQEGDQFLLEASQALGEISAASSTAATSDTLFSAEVYQLALDQYTAVESPINRAKTRFDAIAQAIEERNKRATSLNQRLVEANAAYAAIAQTIREQFGDRQLSTEVTNVLKEAETKLTEATQSGLQYEWEDMARRMQKAEAKIKAAKAAFEAIGKLDEADFLKQIRDLRHQAAELNESLQASDIPRTNAKVAGSAVIEAYDRAQQRLGAGDKFGAYFQLEVARNMFETADRKYREDVQAAVNMQQEATAAQSSAERTIEQVRVILHGFEGEGGQEAKKLYRRAKGKLDAVTDDKPMKKRLTLAKEAKTLAEQALSKAEILIKPKARYTSSSGGSQSRGSSSGGYGNYGSSFSQPTRTHTVYEPVVIETPTVVQTVSSWPTASTTVVEAPTTNWSSAVSEVVSNYEPSVSVSDFSSSISSGSTDSSISVDSW